MSLTDEQIRQTVARMAMAKRFNERLAGQAVPATRACASLVFARFRQIAKGGAR